MQICGEAIEDADRRIVSLWGATQDITEREKREIPMQARVIAITDSYDYRPYKKKMSQEEVK